jgi:hypothetical protein
MKVLLFPDDGDVLRMEVERPVIADADSIPLAGWLDSYSTIELLADDGSILVLLVSGLDVALVYNDSLGGSFHSVGDRDADDVTTFDYLGSYSEIPTSYVISKEHGLAALRAFVRSGVPFNDILILEPD